MTIARSTGALVGTNWTTGVPIATTVTTTGSEVDLLADNTSDGFVDLFLTYIFPNNAPTAGGTIDILFYPSWLAGDAGVDSAPVVFSDTPVQNTTRHVYVGRFPIARFGTGAIKNNATGFTITQAALLYDLVKVS